MILLDEAAAALDVENESEVQEAISKLVKDKTVLIIAHRMRTVAEADKVIVLSGGRVAEEGKPSELMANDGLFAHMTKLQKQSQKWKLA